MTSFDAERHWSLGVAKGRWFRLVEVGLLGRRPFLKLVAGALTTGALAAGGWAIVNHDRNLFQVRRESKLMETSVSVNVYADDPDAARHGIDAAFARMAATSAILNRFDPNSAVARLNRFGQLLDPPAALREVVDRSLSIAAHTEGDFDITVAPVIDYYLSLSRPVTLSPEIRRKVAQRESLVDYRDVELVPGRVGLQRPGTSITLDGIAKGYVVDQGIAALRAAGIEYALVDAGGDLRAIAGADPRRFWNVGIVDPLHTDRVACVVRLRNAALSTSGNYEVFFTADRRLFHIINPHTGYSPDGYSSVTVMADEAIESDAMSVAAFSMDLLRLKQTMAARRQEWLVFSWDGTARWRSQHLPLISGDAAVA